MYHIIFREDLKKKLNEKTVTHDQQTSALSDFEFIKYCGGIGKDKNHDEC